MEITIPTYLSSLSRFTCQDLEAHQEGNLQQKSQERGGRAYDRSIFVKNSKFHVQGKHHFSGSQFWYESQQAFFSPPLNFWFFYSIVPCLPCRISFPHVPQRQTSGSDCQGFQSCANAVLDLVKLVWTRNISVFLVNTHFSVKLSSSLHIPEVSSADTPMHTDNAQVLMQ